MDAQNALSELEQLAEKLEVEVQYDRFTGDGARSGGLCRVKGRWRVIMERRSADSEKVSVLARCLARFDSDVHYVSPAVRQLLELHRPRVEPALVEGGEASVDEAVDAPGPAGPARRGAGPEESREPSNTPQ